MNLFEALRENEIANRSRSPKNKREVDFTPKPTHAPTTIYPSADKVAVLRLRLERGEELWHPEDI